MFSFLFLNLFFFVPCLSIKFTKQTNNPYLFVLWIAHLLFGCVLRYRENFISSWGFWRKLSKSNFNKPPLCIVSIVVFIDYHHLWNGDRASIWMFRVAVCMCGCGCGCPRASSLSNEANLTCAQPQFVHKAVKDYPVYWAFWLTLFTSKCTCVYFEYIAISFTSLFLPYREKTKTS